MPRPVEVLLALAALASVSPLLSVIGLLIRLTSPGPVLFRQERVGMRGTRFTMLKFRTMSVGNAGPGVTAAGDQRVTGVGRFLRRLKLDELPELWNVVRGDLSLVGSRPEVPLYVDLDNPIWRRVLVDRPGITHPVTLALKNEEELIAAAGGDPDKFYSEELLPFKLQGYDEYRETRSWWSDVKVLAATMAALFGIRPYSPTTLESLRKHGR